MLPRRLADPHPLAERFACALNSDGQTAPSPEYEGAGVFNVNILDGRRWSPADAFLHPAKDTGRLTVVTESSVAKIVFNCYIDTHSNTRELYRARPNEKRAMGKFRTEGQK